MDLKLKKTILEEIEKILQEQVKTVLFRHGDIDVAIETREDRDICKQKAKSVIENIKKVFPEIKSLTIEI